MSSDSTVGGKHWISRSLPTEGRVLQGHWHLRLLSERQKEVKERGSNSLAHGPKHRVVIFYS